MVTARSAGPSACQPRDLTLAFRLTSAERERIDTLARSEGVSTSEFARRAVLGGVRASATALGEAREHGREVMRPQITALEDELVRTRKLVTDWRQNAGELYAQLERAPKDLLATARQVVVGVPGSQAALATYWSRIGRGDRSKILPIVAAVVAEDVDRAITALPVDWAAVQQGIDLLGRVEWLMGALTVESGSPFADTDRERRPEWAPLEARCRIARDLLRWELEALSQSETGADNAREHRTG
jgi:hypothetical protein